MFEWLVLSVSGLGLASAAAGAVVTQWQTRRLVRRYPPEGAFVTVEPGVRLHFTERRPQTSFRGTVVLVHGASGNQADLMLALGDDLAAQGFRVVAFDRPGHGWSDRPSAREASSPAVQARLLCAGFDRLGLERVILVGHSWGGILAATLALDHKERVAGLVLLSPVLYPWPGRLAWYYGPASSRLAGPVFNRVLTMPAGLLMMQAGITEVFAPARPPAGYAERTGVALVLRPRTFSANAQDIVDLRPFVVEQCRRLPEIALPTAIVTGSRDSVVSPELHAFQAARAIPGADLTVLEEVGHSPHWSAPEAVIDAVLAVARRAEAGVEPEPARAAS